MQTKEINKLKKDVENILSDNKAVEITSISLKDKTSIADFMIIASGNSSRHIQALSDILVDELKKKEIDGYICLSKFDNFKRGETCLIKNGIFFNKLCVIDKVYENNKIHIIFNFLGREIKYLVSRDDLEPKF